MLYVVCAVKNLPPLVPPAPRLAPAGSGPAPAPPAARVAASPVPLPRPAWPTPGSLTGFVANFAQEVVKGQLPCLWKGLGGQGVEQFGRSAALVALFDHHLPFLDHVHQLDPDQRVLSGLKRLEPEPGASDPLYASMVLFNYIIQRSYWIPGSWNVRMSYTDEVVFQTWI
jgi:hypothetical protein